MKKRLFFAISLIMLCSSAAPLRALAFDPFGNVCSNGNGSQSTVCQTGTPATDPLNDTLAHITNIVTIIAGAAAIIMIIVSALKFITSGSDVSTGSRTDTDVEDARRGLANAVLGLVVIVLARTLILFILNKL